jgi:hypothetical protein
MVDPTNVRQSREVYETTIQSFSCVVLLSSGNRSERAGPGPRMHISGMRETGGSTWCMYVLLRPVRHVHVQLSSPRHHVLQWQERGKTS